MRKSPTFAPAFASSTHKPAGCCTCWRPGPSSRALRSLRTTASWRRRASRARTSGMPGAAGRSAIASSTGSAWRPTRPSARTATGSPSRDKTGAFGSGMWRRVTVSSTFRLTTVRSSRSRGARMGSSWRMPARTGPCMCCRPTTPSEAAWWATSSATVPLCGQSPGGRTDARCSAAAQTARRDCGTPSSTKSCAPWERRTAAPRWRRSTPPGAASCRQAQTAPPGSGVFAAGACCTPSRTGARSKTPSSARTAAWS